MASDDTLCPLLPEWKSNERMDALFSCPVIESAATDSLVVEIDYQRYWERAIEWSCL